MTYNAQIHENKSENENEYEKNGMQCIQVKMLVKVLEKCGGVRIPIVNITYLRWIKKKKEKRAEVVWREELKKKEKRHQHISIDTSSLRVRPHRSLVDRRRRAEKIYGAAVFQKRIAAGRDTTKWAVLNSRNTSEGYIRLNDRPGQLSVQIVQD